MNLLSQIRGSIAVLRYRMHKELGNLINLMGFVRLDVLMIKMKFAVFIEQVIARLIG